MSYTTLYAAFEDGQLKCYAEFRNSWHSAMWIWNHMARKYCGLDGLPLFSELECKQVWALAGDNNVPRAERLAMCTTLDGAVLGPEHAEEVASALESFHEATTNLRSQAAAIRKAFAEGARAVAWQQTSCGDSEWVVYNGDDYRPYCIDTDSKHWWIE